MEISLHSNQKHIALSYYLQIIRNLIKSPRTPFDILYYIDLYCGDGECEIKKTHECYEPPLIKSILKEVDDNFQVECFLNDIEEDKINKIKEKTKQYNSSIKCYLSKDANEAYKEILEKIPQDQFCICFLDPYNHKHLKWQTIKEISEHVHEYYDKKNKCMKIRRPELIINCMTYTMTGSYMAKDFQSINENLGTDEWIPLIEDYKDKGLPIPHVFLHTFINQLKKLGYKVPTPIEIKSTKACNDIYYLVWATNENGFDIIEKKVVPYMKKTIQKAHKKNRDSLKKAEAREKGNCDITKWIN